jgi:hypothetical protein
MGLGPNAREYMEVVAAFRELTDYQWRVSERCCQEVKDGVPECCYQIVEGADLTFTQSERLILDDVCQAGLVLWQRPSDSMFVLDRDAYDHRRFLEKDLHQGWLADTLECASHPLRPVIGPGGQVMGTVAVKACNASLGIGEWRAERDLIRQLWQKAVDLTGLKPYYITDRFRGDMMLI